MRKVFTSAFLFFALFLFSPAYAAFPVNYDEMIDITNKDASFKLSENSLIVSMERHAKPMRPFNVQFHFNHNNIEVLTLTTNMKMNMGNFKFAPKDLGYGNYVITDLTLPKCGSGDGLWYGQLDIKFKSGKTETVYFFYNLN